MAKSFELNLDQKKAVEHKVGPIIVVAGAGTGKTRVITERIKRLIEVERFDSDSILALTFTEKAAKEMLDRIGDVMPLGYKEPWVSTFHSFADRILRKEGLEIGLDTGYEILTYPKQWLLVRKNLFDFDLKYFRPLGNPTKFISAILKFISRLQDEDISVKEFEDFVKKDSGDPEEKIRWLELVSFYAKFQELKLSNSKLDFGDLISWTLKLFRERPHILAKYQKQFEHILVDEFQDTNLAQYNLVKLLYPVKERVRSLMVVGDDSQSIYKFRGAAVSNILEFRDDYKDSLMLTLLHNYRSGQRILDGAYSLIQNNNPDTLEFKLGINKKLISVEKKDHSLAKVLSFACIEEETEFTVSKIQEALAENPEISFKDVAILARANNHLDPFVLAMRSAGIPYQLVGNRGLYDKDEVRNILAYLRVLTSPQDGVALYRVLNNPVFNVAHVETSRLLSDAKYKKISLWDCLHASKDEDVTLLLEKINSHTKQMLKTLPSAFIFSLVRDTGMLDYYTREENAQNLLSVGNLNLFLEEVKKFERDYYKDTKSTPTILDFIDYLDLMIEAGDNPAQAEIEDIDTVSLSTVHAAKGLEYQLVFVVNLVSGRFPSRERGDAIEIPQDLIKETLPTGDEHEQEERRLFYVALTRAKKYLFLTHANNYGGKRDTTPSGFLAETGLQNGLSEKNNSKDRSTIFGLETPYRNSHGSSHFSLDYVNYTQISTFKTCPAKYKYAYVIKIPTEQSHALTFGNSIHATLRDFHAEKLHVKDISLDRLLELYQKNWDPAGYLDEKHREQRFLSGIELLKSYYQVEKDAPSKVIEIEKTINLRLAGVKFSGRVDRIDQIDGSSVEIIDYKTGKLKEQKDVDSDMQTSLYAWGVKESLHLDPKVLSLYFVEDGKKISTSKSPEEVSKQLTVIEGIVDDMKNGDFTAAPGMHCKWCDFRNICPSASTGF